MKRILLGFIALAIALGLYTTVVAVTGEPLPPGSVPHQAWELIDKEWVPMRVGDLTVRARAFSSGPVIGSCNKLEWQIPVKVHASVAQWIEFSISGTRYDWQVRKPGTYAANSLTATLKSNGDVGIDFDGFEDLQYLGQGGVKQTIDTWYAYGEGADPGDINWIPAAQVNELDAVVEDSCGLHSGYSWKLWNKIRVTECNSACEYEDNAMITLVLKNQKIWIDPETGNFLPPFVSQPD